MTDLRMRIWAALTIGLAPAVLGSCSASSETSVSGSGGAPDTGGSGGATAGSGGATDTAGAAGTVGGSGGATASGGNGGTTTSGGGGVPGLGDADAAADSNPVPDAGTAGCPAPPTGSPAAAVAALDATNAVRLKMGVPCLALVPALDDSAQKHCDYYAANNGNQVCIANAHAEVSGCTGFVAASFGDRERAGGYTGTPTSEVMAFRNNPAAAVQGFVDTVYHRTPMLSPWIRDMGYGGTTGCDTIDFGRGIVTPNTVTALYPYAGQTGVPLSFDGSREGPVPPAPPGGWPSGYPVHLFAKTLTVSSHVFTVDGSPTPIEHTWIAESSDFILYAHTPLTPLTKYHVVIAGTRGTEALTFDWTFTTK